MRRLHLGSTFLVLATALVLAAGAPAAPQQGPGAPDTGDAAVFPVPRIPEGIPWDAPTDDPVWRTIPVLEPRQSAPVFGAEPSERTQFRLAYDGEYLYAAAWMFDSDPEGVRAVSLRRDESSFANDWFLVSLDTFRDRENTLLFATSPAGVRTDAAIGDDGSPPANLAWDTYWDAVVVRNADGWRAVVRIPFSSLRFEAQEGVVRMGITLARRIARRNEMISWPAIPHDWGVFSIYKASLMNEIQLEGVASGRPIHVTPYLLAGVVEERERAGGGDGFSTDREARREPGLDLKYSPATNLTVDFTLNPDFAHVEADDFQVNLTRFSLFLPERRPFFQERASVFDYSLGESDRIFHSRRIGLVQGVPIRIHGGGRMVAHGGGWDLGILTMQTDALDEGGSENTGVLRVRRQVGNEHSTVGGILTSRLGPSGRRHVTWGGDANVRLGGEEYLTLNWAGSRDESTGGVGMGDRSFVRLRWERRGIYGLAYDFEAARVGAHFEPRLGYLARNGYGRVGGEVAYGRRASESSRLLGSWVSVLGRVYRRFDGQVESAVGAPSIRVESKTGRAAVVTARLRREHLDHPFALGPSATIPAGNHEFRELEVHHVAPRTGDLQVPASLLMGEFYDGRRASATVAPTWTPSAHLQVSGRYQWNRVAFDGDDRHFRSHLVRLGALAMADTRWSGRLVAQYGSAARTVAVNLRLRYNPREGEDLHLVYDHAFRTDRMDHGPSAPLTRGRVILIKYSRSFTLEF